MPDNGHSAEEALERAIAFLAPFPTGRPDCEEWDITTEGDFRVPFQFESEAVAETWCIKVVEYYRHSIARDEVATGLSLAQIQQEVREIKFDLEALANRLEALSIDTYRIIVEGLSSHIVIRSGTKFTGHEIFKLIVPMQWDVQGPSRSILSEKLHAVATQFEAVIRPVRLGGTAILAHPDTGGRRKIPQALGVPTPTWLLTHLGWELFRHMGRPMPTTSVGGKLNQFLSAIHESATREPLVSFEGSLKEYRTARQKFEDVEMKLRLTGVRYGWSSFDECQHFLAHNFRPTVPLTKSVRTALRMMAQEYLKLQHYLLTGKNLPPDGK